MTTGHGLLGAATRCGEGQHHPSLNRLAIAGPYVEPGRLRSPWACQSPLFCGSVGLGRYLTCVTNR